MRRSGSTPARSRPRSIPATNARSIWPAIYPELLRLVREHSSTIVFVNNRRAPSGSRSASTRCTTTSWRRSCRRPSTPGNSKNGDKAPPRSPAPTTAPCPTRSAPWSRSCSSRASSPAWSPPPRWSSGSTWAPSTWSSRSSRRSPSPAGCSASAAPATPSARSRRAGSSPSSGPTCSSARSSPGGCARARSRRRSSRRTRSTSSPSTWSRWRRSTSGRSTRSRSWSAPRSPSPSSPASSSRTCSTCSTAATRRSASPSCGRGSSGTGPRARCAAGPGARQLAVANAGTIPDRGLYGVHLPDGRRVGELDEEMVYEARPGQTFLLGASTWRIEEITRDRVIVTPAPGTPGAVPFWRGDGIGRPAELGRAIGAFAREAVERRPEEARQGERPRQARRAEPRQLPDRAAGGDPGRPLRRGDRDRALPRRDRRLAALRPLAVRRPRARGLGPRARRPRSETTRTSRPMRSGRTTASSSISPTRTSRPPATW